MKSYQITFTDGKVRTVANVPNGVHALSQESGFLVFYVGDHFTEGKLIASFRGVTQFWETSLAVSGAQKKDWVDENREL